MARSSKLSSVDRAPLTSSALQPLLRQHAPAADVPMRVSPHTLRHTCATPLRQGGADIRHVQKLLGHRSIESTAIHTRVFPKDLAQMVEKAHPRERAYN